MSVFRIDSPDNPRVRRVAALLRKKEERVAQGCVVIENPVMLKEALSCGVTVEEVYFDEACLLADPSLVRTCEESGSSVFSVSDRILRKMSALEVPQGVSAVIRTDSLPRFALRENARYVICERLSDPGNLGTIIRTADAMGFDGVVLSKGSVDAFSPKVVRATMGSFFRVPLLIDADLANVCADMRRHNVQMLAAVLAADAVPLTDLSARGGVAVMIGNEAAGLSDEAVGLCDVKAHIPMAGRAESLNAAVAAAIFMWHFRCNG